MKDNVLLHTVQKERLGHVVQDVEDSEIVLMYSALSRHFQKTS